MMGGHIDILSKNVHFSLMLASKDKGSTVTSKCNVKVESRFNGLKAVTPGM